MKDLFQALEMGGGSAHELEEMQDERSHKQSLLRKMYGEAHSFSSRSSASTQSLLGKWAWHPAKNVWICATLVTQQHCCLCFCKRIQLHADCHLIAFCMLYLSCLIVSWNNKPYLRCAGRQPPNAAQAFEEFKTVLQEQQTVDQERIHCRMVLKHLLKGKVELDAQQKTYGDIL